MTGVAEAGEINCRIQIPINGRAPVAAALDAVAQLLRDFVDTTAPAAADRQALRRQILEVATAPAEPLTSEIAR